MYPSDYQYTREHEWVRVEGKQATIGITDFAQKQLGEVVFIDIPTIGKKVNQAEELGTIESVKAVAEFYAPIDGEVIEINSEASDNPELVNDDPHGEGWLVKLKITNMSQLKGLMSAEQYEEYIKSGES